MDRGRLIQIPAKRKKRLVVLRWLADHFRPAERYSEAQVNDVLRRYHEDVATLRRAMVDEELMQRGSGFYWRAGTLPPLRGEAARSAGPGSPRNPSVSWGGGGGLSPLGR
jgi:hypothetical protein